MENVRHVPCPGCSKPLYKSGPIDFAASVLGSSDDFPNIISQGQGDYLKCRHCSKFVLMQRVTAPAGGVDFEIHPSHEFFEKIPQGE